MKRILFGLVVVLSTSISGSRAAGPVALTLHPAKAPKPRNKYQLLPKAKEHSDSDALPLYKRAVQSLPKDSQTDQKIRQWVKTPLNKLPRQQVQSTLQQFKPTLQLVEQAAKCKQCNWPPFDPEPPPQNLSEYRKLAYLLFLQTRLQSAQGQYDQAVRTIQTGLAMARHIGQGPTLVQRLVSIAIAELMCGQVEQFVQGPDAPNLYWALQGLPKPFIDLTEQTVLQSPDIRERTHLLMNRLDRHVAILQCIEALRLYAAVRKGKFPGALTEITKIHIPNDPVTKTRFVYSRAGSKAVLEGPAPKGAKPKDAMRYQLTLKE
ncbi:MAG: hypothetical protein ACYS6W_16845 [Planctomycetota bacterium]|jgi:tetratricopeptide (TPR) repeat protein